MVRTLINNEFLSNDQSIFWDGKDDDGLELTNGIYFYKLTNGNKKSVKKIVKVE